MKWNGNTKWYITVNLKDLFLVCYYSCCTYCIYGILPSGSKFEVFLLADDTNLMYKDKSLTLFELVLNEELPVANVCNWLFHEL